MAYPFLPMRPLGDVIKHAVENYHAELVNSQSQIVGPRGPASIRYLKRTINGSTKFAVLPETSDAEPVTPTVLRSICNRLQIPLKDFGFDLEEGGWQENKHCS